MTRARSRVRKPRIGWGSRRIVRDRADRPSRFASPYSPRASRPKKRIGRVIFHERLATNAPMSLTASWYRRDRSWICCSSAALWASTA